jgi:uncharacterized protein (TIGR03437 family)
MIREEVGVRNLRRSAFQGALLCLLVLVAERAWAQADVATTFDGQKAFFSSFSRMPGSTDAPLSTTIFEYTSQSGNAGTWTAVAHSDSSGNVLSPFLTADASILGWQKGPYFYFGNCGDCILRSSSALSGIDMSSVKIYPFLLAISPNGRFLATPGYLADFFTTPPAVQDLTTGQVWNPAELSGSSFYSEPFQVADDGTLIGLKTDSNGFLLQPPVLVRWRPGVANKDILTAPLIRGFSLSADGHSAAVLTQPTADTIQINLVDLETGSSQTILPQSTAPSGPWRSSMSVSADGRRAAFFFPDALVPDFDEEQTPQVFFWASGAGAPTPLSGLPEGAAGAVISGNGAVAWVATKTNRLLRFDLNQGTMQEILSAFPTLLQIVASSPVPGSVVQFLGGNPVAGEHFRSNGLEFPIVPSDAANETLIQVPWELASQVPAQGYTSLPLVVTKDGYPFEQPLEFSATGAIMPNLEQTPSANDTSWSMKAAAADFSHLIDNAHPAMPGETIVVWLTGLGPLDQPVATGAPGPSNPPAHPLAHLECGLGSLNGGPRWQGLVLPFIGYAPGLVGVYQVNVTIPAGWPAGMSLLDCYSGQQSSTQSLPIGAPSQ